MYLEGCNQQSLYQHIFEDKKQPGRTQSEPATPDYNQNSLLTFQDTCLWIWPVQCRGVRRR